LNQRSISRLNRRTFLGVGIGALCLPAFANRGDEADMAFMASTITIRTSLGHVAHRDLGHGPAALFLHGWPLNAHEWRKVMPALTAYRRCLAPDLLGFGATQADAAVDPTPSQQVSMLSEYLDQLHAREVDIVANDSGALIAQLFTARYPQRVRSLLLTNCDVAGDSPPPAFLPLAKAASAGKLVDLFIKPQLADIQRARSARGIGSAFSDPAALTPELLNNYLGPLVSSPLREHQFNVLSAALGVDELSPVQHQLAAYQGPVRILWGIRDRFFSSKSPDILDRTFKGSRGVRRIDDANLYLPEDRPDLIIDEARLLWGG
jgi:pimeloyl-ACP methyl ester carboxylesterase